MNNDQVPNIEANSKRHELIFGLVGPTGVDLTKVCEALSSQLRAVGYQTKIITLSDLILPYCGTEKNFANEYERIDTLMSEGTNLRRITNQADIVARLGLTEIRSQRRNITGDIRKPVESGMAYIVRSFKRPEEVQLYRDTYGRAFTLISIYAPREIRKRNLATKLQSSSHSDVTAEELAIKLISRDHAEDGKLGQKVSSTFPLADFFLTSGSLASIEGNLKRLVRLTFGDPYISPTRDEQGMFFAQAAALRSLDLSRQVGAAITSTDGEVIATGCNEVPKFGGGLYWEGDEGIARDAELGYDSNAQIKHELITDALGRMQRRGWLIPPLNEKSADALAKEAVSGDYGFFKDSKIFDVIEFGRAVHAEMAAIAQSAFEGRSLKGARLYCTTFPCHICARHIVASGINEVVFIEPYEKSRTDRLYSDSISVEPHEPSPKRANFRSFVGVAPRRYMDYFSMAGNRKNEDGKVLASDSMEMSPRIRRIILTYLIVEEKMISEIEPIPHQQQTLDGD